MHEELDITLDLLRDQHPNFGHHTSKKEVEQSFADAKKAIVRPLNLLAYYRILFPLVSQIGEFHTYLGGNDDFLTDEINYAKIYCLPFTLKFQPQFAVIGQNDNDIPVGTHIVKINRKSIPEILEKTGRYISRDGLGENAALYHINKGFSFLHFLAFGSRKTYVLQLRLPDGNIVTKTVQSVSYYDETFAHNRERLGQLGQNFETVTLQELEAIYFRIISFGVSPEKFEKEIGSLIKKAKSAKHLILDLRDNPGGRSGNAEFLLRRLIHNPIYAPRYFHTPSKKLKALAEVKSRVGLSKNGRELLEEANEFITLFKKGKSLISLVSNGNYRQGMKKNPSSKGFRGQIHILVNGGTASAASGVARHLRDTGFVTLYGSAPNGTLNRGCSQPSHFYRLRYSYFKLSVAWLCRANKIMQTTQFIEPDYPFVDLEPDRHEKDRLLEFVIEKIQQLHQPPLPKPKPSNKQLKAS